MSPNEAVTRFPMRARRIRVEEIAPAGRRFVSIRFGGLDLADFVSPGPGDHVKLQVPGADGTLILPEIVDGKVTNRAELALRDMTPREVRDGRLRIDFARHGGGEVGRWLERAAVGDECAIVGPRGSRPAVVGADAVCFVVDATAVPSAERRTWAQADWVRERGAQEDGARGSEVRGRLHLVVREAGDVDLDLPEAIDVVEHVLGDAIDGGGWPGIADAVAATLPASGTCTLWAAGEAAGVATIRRVAREAEREGLTAAFNGYWRAGESGYDHHAPLPEG